MKSIKGFGMLQEFRDEENFVKNTLTEYSVTFKFFGDYKDKEAIRVWIDELHSFLIKGE